MRNFISALIFAITLSVPAFPQCGASGTLIFNPISLQFDCTGSASAATPAFSAITAGTNAAALVMGTGGSLTTSGSGTINATSLGGTAAAGYQTLLSSSNKLGLAAGGTNADLSATGGTSQFLKQASSGAAVTVARPACADLSDSAASCSTDATNATNISSGTLAIARGGTGSSSLAGAGIIVSGGALGTPSSGTATNLTGLPLTTGVTGVLPAANGGAGLTVATGSLLATFPNTATVNPYQWGTGGAVSSGSHFQPFPVAGRIRNLYAVTSTSNGSGVYECFGTLLGFPLFNTTIVNPSQSLCVIPSAASGSYGPGGSSDFWHVPQGGTGYITFGKNGAGTTNATVQDASAEFVADSGSVTVMFGAGNGGSPGASTTSYWAPIGSNGGVGSTNTDSLVAAIPMPFAGTLSNAGILNRTTPTNNATLTMEKIAAGGTSTADTSITVTVLAADTAPTYYVDTTHTDTAAAGDSYAWKVVTGASTQMGIGAMSSAYTASSGTHTAVFALVGTTQAASTKFYLPNGSGQNALATVATADVVIPFACTATNLYVFQGAQNGGGITSAITLEQNDADTALTGTVTSSTPAGSVLLDGTHTVSLAAGDKISIKIVVAGGTSGKMGGISFQCN